MMYDASLTQQQCSAVYQILQRHNTWMLQYLTAIVPQTLLCSRHQLAGEIVRAFLVLNGAFDRNDNTHDEILRSFLVFSERLCSQHQQILRTRHIVPTIIATFLNTHYRGCATAAGQPYAGVWTPRLLKFAMRGQMEHPDWVTHADEIDTATIESIATYWATGAMTDAESRAFSDVAISMARCDLSHILTDLSLAVYHNPHTCTVNKLLGYMRAVRRDATLPSYYLRTLPHDWFHEDLVNETLATKNFRVGLKLYVAGDVLQNTIDTPDVVTNARSNHIWPPEVDERDPTSHDENNRETHKHGYAQMFFITSFTRVASSCIPRVLPDVLKCYGGRCFQRVSHWHYVVFTKYPHRIQFVARELTRASCGVAPVFVSVERVYTSFHRCVEYIDTQVVEVDQDYTDYRNSREFFDDPDFGVVTDGATCNWKRRARELAKGIYPPFFSPRLLNDFNLSGYASFMRRTADTHFNAAVRVIERGCEMDARRCADIVSCGMYHTIDVSKQGLISTVFRTRARSYLFHSVVLIIGPRGMITQVKDGIITREFPWMNVEFVVLSPTDNTNMIQ